MPRDKYNSKHFSPDKPEAVQDEPLFSIVEQAAHTERAAAFTDGSESLLAYLQKTTLVVLQQLGAIASGEKGADAAVQMKAIEKFIPLSERALKELRRGNTPVEGESGQQGD